MPGSFVYFMIISNEEKNNKTHFFMFYTLIKHGFLTNRTHAGSYLYYKDIIGHNFKTTLCLCFKMSPCAKPFENEFDFHEMNL